MMSSTFGRGKALNYAMTEYYKRRTGEQEHGTNSTLAQELTFHHEHCRPTTPPPPLLTPPAERRRLVTEGSRQSDNHGAENGPRSRASSGSTVDSGLGGVSDVSDERRIRTSSLGSDHAACEVSGACLCHRSVRDIVCTGCGHNFRGRISRSCPSHPRVIQLMDIGNCPHCLCDHLKEFGSDD